MSKHANFTLDSNNSKIGWLREGLEVRWIHVHIRITVNIYVALDPGHMGITIGSNSWDFYEVLYVSGWHRISTQQMAAIIIITTLYSNHNITLY